ncbi:GLPGLI family protein [Flavobacterium sp. 25HG05S-40]|uniref:GLPGLI family protein n=1 Tax=Flavobacterium sp. 25HG05S-40 TaxID=3458682 RepID=UPI004044BC8D
MIKIITKIIVAILLATTSMLKAQNFQGQAFYKSKTNIEASFNIESPGLNEEMKKKIMENMKKEFEKEYILTFNKTESIYEEEQKLEAPSPSVGGGVVVKMGGGDGKAYKNIKNKVSITEEDFFGKEFLITDSLSTYQWKLESETKKIGDYTCYKATYLIPVSESEKEAYEKLKNKKEDGKTQFMMLSEPKEQLITVWYTPEIPFSHGPGEYWGLPGLILEANFDKTVILCSKVILNPKEKLTIKVPNKGKKVTKSEYERLVQEQLEQMSNQSDEKGGIRIEVHR